MNRKQADIILKLLEAATAGNWPTTASLITDPDEAGFSPEEVIDAWKALEKIAHVNGTAPEPGDF